MAEMRMLANVEVWTDSSAAVGICGRSGLGKLRHVQTRRRGSLIDPKSLVRKVARERLWG